MKETAQLTTLPDGALRLEFETPLEMALAFPGLFGLAMVAGGSCSAITEGTSALFPIMGAALLAAAAYLHGRVSGDTIIDPVSSAISRERGTHRIPVARFDDIALVTLGCKVGAMRRKWVFSWGVLAVRRDGSLLWLSNGTPDAMESPALQAIARQVSECLGVPLVPPRPGHVVVRGSLVSRAEDLSYQTFAKRKARHMLFQFLLVLFAVALLVGIGALSVL